MRRRAGMTLLAGILLTGCISWVSSSEGGKQVELVKSTYLATAKCKEVAEIRVASDSDERSAVEGLTVVQVKAKNVAYAEGATHVVERETVEFACDRDGQPDEEGNRTCTRLLGTAYECLVGR